MATEAAEAVALTQSETPSVEFVEAVSELLQTDAADLLAEMGYYDDADTLEEAASNPR